MIVLFLSSVILVHAEDDAVWGLSPKNLVAPVSIYRFFNTVQGGHLYTISTIERDYIIDNFPEWNYEGVKFYVSENLSADTTAVYRFFNHVRGGHLYTISEIERDAVMQLPDWTYEGVPFYVYPLAPAPVPRTGQTVSYRAGDDGDYQMGVPWPEPRFTDNGDATVTDNLTGLMWSQNANIDGSKNWDDAIDWCNSLDHGGYGDWRLPNIREMFSLIDLANYDSALPDGHPFTGVQSYYYWSSTTSADFTDVAWHVYMHDGYVYYSSKTITLYVWPVRSGQ